MGKFAALKIIQKDGRIFGKTMTSQRMCKVEAGCNGLQATTRGSRWLSKVCMRARGDGVGFDLKDFRQPGENGNAFENVPGAEVVMGVVVTKLQATSYRSRTGPAGEGAVLKGYTCDKEGRDMFLQRRRHCKGFETYVVLQKFSGD